MQYPNADADAIFDACLYITPPVVDRGALSSSNGNNLSSPSLFMLAGSEEPQSVDR